MSRVCICMQFHVFARVYMCVSPCTTILLCPLSLSLSLSLVRSFVRSFMLVLSLTRILRSSAPSRPFSLLSRLTRYTCTRTLSFRPPFSPFRSCLAQCSFSFRVTISAISKSPMLDSRMSTELKPLKAFPRKESLIVPIARPRGCRSTFSLRSPLSCCTDLSLSAPRNLYRTSSLAHSFSLFHSRILSLSLAFFSICGESSLEILCGVAVKKWKIIRLTFERVREKSRLETRNKPKRFRLLVARGAKLKFEIPNVRNSHEAPSAFHPAARGISHDFRHVCHFWCFYLSIYLYII